jgi:hypothetical protein
MTSRRSSARLSAPEDARVSRSAATISPRWRTLCLVLGALCAALLWRDCSRAATDATAAAPATDRGRPHAAAWTEHPGACTTEAPPAGAAAATGSGDGEPAADVDGAGGAMLYGVQVPGWVTWLAPHPGEDLRAYRDRMLPLAIAAIAPQRSRVARSRDRFAELAHLDAAQRAALDAAAQDTAAALQDRVMTAVLAGELAPAAFKPMVGVDLARDVLDLVARGNRRFVESLRADQRASLAHHPFDFGDYLVFSTRWEDALRAL